MRCQVSPIIIISRAGTICALKIRPIYMTECPEYLDKENRWL
jgi:hypothetical protein